MTRHWYIDPTSVLVRTVVSVRSYSTKKLDNGNEPLVNGITATVRTQHYTERDLSLAIWFVDKGALGGWA